MRIVLHIGTHKTGTSSVQNVLARNRDALRAQGVHYPLSAHSGRNVNFLAARVATDRLDEARAFLRGAAAKAAQADCDRMLLSAESFYGMTGFFRNLVDRPVQDYWEAEHAAVTRLARLLRDEAGASDVQVLVYLRGQDRFLESIYGQFVKQAPGYHADIGSFIEKAGPIADYRGHLGIWGDAFGDAALHIRRYDAVASDLLADFLRTGLAIADLSGFAPGSPHVNPSLSGELLAFKRGLNRMEQPLADAFVASKVVERMSAGRFGGGRAAFMLKASERRALLEAHRSGNLALLDRFAAKPDASGKGDTEVWVGRWAGFADPTADAPEPNDALTPDRALVLYRAFSGTMNAPRIRAEVMLRRTSRRVLTQFPSLERWLGILRRILNRRRVEKEGAAPRH